MDPIRPIGPRERDLEQIYRVEHLRDERRREQEERERRKRRRAPADGGGPPDDDEEHLVDVRV